MNTTLDTAKKRLDKHAMREAASILEEQAMTVRLAMGQPGAEKELAAWIKRRRKQPLRTQIQQASHWLEMACRLRKMLHG